MVTETRSGFKPHTVEYIKAQQVNVPNTYELQQVVAGTCCTYAAAEKDPSTLTTRFAPASTQIPIEYVFSNALHLLSSAYVDAINAVPKRVRAESFILPTRTIPSLAGKSNSHRKHASIA